MQDIHPLRLSTHANQDWTPSTRYSFAADTLVVPLAMDELSTAAVKLPLGFTTGEKPTLVALTGLRPKQNLFIGPDGRWLGDYVPAVLRGYPFKLLPATGDQYALGFDHASGLLSDAGQGEAFFQDGKPTERIQQILNFLIRLNKGLERSAAAAATLQSHGVLEPWPLKVKDGDTEIPVQGLLRVSEEKLARLDDTAFLALRKGGVLALAYAQLFSMANIETLGKLARLHAHHAREASKHQQDIKSMFVPPQAEDEIDWDAMLKDDKD